MNEEKKTTRMFFVDNLRILLTILVLAHHTMITYGASGGWYFRDPHTDELTSIILTISVTFNQAFFMGLFFFISAFFVPGSYDRKGSSQFLKDRFIRLGIPILIYIVIVNPILVYILFVGNEISFAGFYLSYFQSWEGLGRFLGGNGPLWFIVVLLIFSVFYCLWRQISKEHFKKEINEKPLLNKQILFIIVIMAGLSFLVRIWIPQGWEIFNLQLGNFVQYIMMLILGTMAYRRDWLQIIPDSQGKLWLRIALVSFPIFVIIGILGGALEDVSVFQRGLTWQQLVYSTWDSLFCMGMSIGLITLFRKKFNDQGEFTKKVSGDMYTVYLIHAPVLISVSLLFAGILIFALLKFVIVFPIVVLLCILISHYILRKIPGAKRILG